ncbi:MAG: putative secreted protein [Chitinophagaceae bacterium]|nr:putative secreted protein [Chitinophagaceae bacterium]
MKTTNQCKTIAQWSTVFLLAIAMVSCKKSSDDSTPSPSSSTSTVIIENVLESKPLVESGTFKGSGSPAVIMPGESVMITFSAAKGEALSFAAMYGWSNDLFFAPANPGITLYDGSGVPIQGDVSAQIKLWDNGSRVNQAPGNSVTHPGTAESNNIAEVSGTDAQGNTYLAASALLKATLVYNSNSTFTLTLMNNSTGTANETPISPGVWAVSYIAGGQLMNAAPLYASGQMTTDGLTAIAEMGNNSILYTYIQTQTGIFTPLSPILVVVYNGINNPIYSSGQNDQGKGLKYLAQRGNADTLATYLRQLAGVKAVYVLAAPSTKVLLPSINGQPGGIVSQDISVNTGDRLAIATMYGFSNDWFFASQGNGVDATVKGDISSSISLYDDGTAIDQFPGAGITQFNLAGTPLVESKPIAAVPNPNPFTTLPAVSNIIRVTIN